MVYSFTFIILNKTIFQILIDRYKCLVDYITKDGLIGHRHMSFVNLVFCKVQMCHCESLALHPKKVVLTKLESIVIYKSKLLYDFLSLFESRSITVLTYFLLSLSHRLYKVKVYPSLNIFNFTKYEQTD